MVGNKKEHIKIPSETADIAACIQNELGIHSALHLSGGAEMINKPIKQRNIFIRELESLTNDIAVSGVLLTGSVACGCASENSDIDIIVLCDRHCFETHFTDGILVS